MKYRWDTHTDEHTGEVSWYKQTQLAYIIIFKSSLTHEYHDFIDICGNYTYANDSHFMTFEEAEEDAIKNLNAIIDNLTELKKEVAE